ncbi:MAG TPA: hydroxymethylglutaryl-CoA lyase [Chthoniobacterales bacterium]|jgi:hydroxymethylglutaryl-CoA lyase|nr:hydroxymethylglutaryl-CoA lyase [Chthoniobacterales bacterium]
MANQSVKLIECPRDAWQGLPRQIPTGRKAQYLGALIGVGFKNIDAASFVSPKAVPQMADSEQVLEQLDAPNDVEIIGIVVNEKGAERAIATKRVTTLGYPCSISQTFLRRNQNQSPEENFETLSAIKSRADKADVDLVVYVSMAFGNPYGDSWSEDELRAAIARIAELGIRSISLADTVGLADAKLIQQVMTAVLKPTTGCEIGVHLHSTPADAVGKILAAYDAGCRRFDSAIGGLGGCPFAQNRLVGNIPTESVIAALKQRGVDLSLKIDNVVQLNAKIGSEFA